MSDKVVYREQALFFKKNRTDGKFAGVVLICMSQLVTTALLIVPFKERSNCLVYSGNNTLS